jgi:hypothetical protein
VVACPAMAPGIIRFAFLDIGQDVVCCDQHSIALKPHVEGQLSYGGRGMAAIGVVEFDEGIEAVLGVCIALSALEDLVGRRCSVRGFGLWPFQQLCIIAVRGRILVLGVGSLLSCELRT